LLLSRFERFRDPLQKLRLFLNLLEHVSHLPARQAEGLVQPTHLQKRSLAVSIGQREIIRYGNESHIDNRSKYLAK